MSRTLKEKQQAFRQKLQTEGADSFADGPHPWEQWDESGNQHDNRVWEGTARRIHPQHRRTRGFGDRLLSGLAVVALASMVVGIVGIYFSTPTTLSTTQQARTVIQPPPIVASRMNAPPAMQPDETADMAAPVLANLDTLSPPAAGTPADRDEYQAVLEPVVTAPGTTPVIPPDSIDSVAVETVITEETVATTGEPTTVAQAEIVDTEPAAIEKIAAVVTEPTVVAQTEITDIEPAVVEEAEEVATEPTLVAQAEIAGTDPAAIEEAAEMVTEPTLVAQAETIDTEPTVVEKTEEVVTEPTLVAQVEITDTDPAAVEKTE
ncbi:MAG TPA: hypothetical protein DCO71_08000, partial [Gammaproteobacteria bacterium]|nr:hypothetical protein [Gammaproteobacteria bacterium]